MKELKMQEHKTNGTLITFCGLDGCGKSSMIQKLSEWITCHYRKNIRITKQPSNFIRQSDIFRTFMDKPDNDAYEYRSLSLLAAGDRLQHSRKVILPELEEGKCVISDRYFYSCIANLLARGYTKDQWIYEIAGMMIKPDIAFFLDVPVNMAVSRVRARASEKDRYIDMDLQYWLREEYLNIAEMNGGIIIDSSQSEEETFELVINSLRDKFKIEEPIKYPSIKSDSVLFDKWYSDFKPYLIKPISSSLDTRTGPGDEYSFNTTIGGRSVYTIVEEHGKGIEKWGLLESGEGWIRLEFTNKIKENEIFV